MKNVSIKLIYNICLCLFIVYVIGYSIYYIVADSRCKYSSYTLYNEQIELEYNKSKCLLVEAVQQYIDSISPYSSLNGLLLVNKCIEYDIDICFVLAQAQKESNFGTAGLARKTNSVWNVYAYDNTKYSEINDLGKYSNPNYSIEPYLKLLRKRYLSNKTEYDLMIKYVDIDENRYASDKTYEASLLSIYNSITTTTLIDLYSQDFKKYQMIYNNK